MIYSAKSDPGRDSIRFAKIAVGLLVIGASLGTLGFSQVPATQVTINPPTVDAARNRAIIYTRVQEGQQSVSGLGAKDFKITVDGKDTADVAVVPTFARQDDKFGIVLVVDTSGFKDENDPLWARSSKIGALLLSHKSVDKVAVLSTGGTEFPFSLALDAGTNFRSLKPGAAKKSLSELITQAASYVTNKPDSLQPVVVVLASHPISGLPQGSDLKRPVEVIDIANSNDAALKTLAESSGGQYYVGSAVATGEGTNTFVAAAIKAVAQVYAVSFPVAKGTKDCPPFTMEVSKNGKLLAKASYAGRPIELIYFVVAGIVTLILLIALFITLKRVLAAKKGYGDQNDPYSSAVLGSALTEGVGQKIFDQGDVTSGMSGGGNYQRYGGAPTGGDDATQGEWAPPVGMADATEGEGVAVISAAYVEVVSGSITGTRADLRGTLLLGREAGVGGENLVLIGDQKVSRKHAEIRMEPGSMGRPQFRVVNISSTNPTYVNERPVQDQVLRDGDEIRIGTTKLKFHENAAGAGGRRPDMGDVTSGDFTAGGDVTL